MKKRLRRTFIALASLAAFTAGCASGPSHQETVEAEEIAEGEEIADKDAKVDTDDLGNITYELILKGDQDLFDSVDKDRNRLLDRDEYEDMSEQVSVFGKFKVNEDRKLGEDEFNAVMFEYWDTNDSGFVSAPEYLAGALNWFPSDTDELENFADIDADDDGLLSKGEFVGNMDDIALFDQWDLDDDAEVGREELMSVLRIVWDIDDDERVTVDEWGGPKPMPNNPIAGVVIFPAQEKPDTTKAGSLVSGEGKVEKVISDRGFWLTGENGESRLFAVVREDVPKKEMIDIDQGDRIRMVGLLMDSKDMNLVAGELEEDARQAIESEPVFLSIYHGQVEFLEEGS